MEDISILAKDICCFRTLLGISQEEFANILGLNRVTLSALESGNKASTSTLFRIYYHLNKYKEEIEGIENKATNHNICLQIINETLNEIDSIIENNQAGYQKRIKPNKN